MRNKKLLKHLPFTIYHLPSTTHYLSFIIYYLSQFFKKLGSITNYKPVVTIVSILVTIIILVAPPFDSATAQQKPHQWVTFTEAAFGFEIQYPSNWYPVLVVDNVNRVDEYGEHVALRSIGFFGPNSQIVFVDIWLNSNQLSPSQWLEKNPPHFIGTASTVQTQSSLRLNKNTGARLTATPLNLNTNIPSYYRTQFNQDDLSIGIEYAALSPNINTYETMLNSFKITPPTQSRTTASTLSTALPPAEYGAMTATCCNITDFEYNPFPCNTSGDDTCAFPPCGNCTWWVRYRRIGDAETNVIHCSGDGDTWLSCANQYYPHLVLEYPDTDAITLYPTINHVSYVEQYNGNYTYAGSEQSWYDPCPTNYFTGITGNGKFYLHNPEGFVPNQAPYAPSLKTPHNNTWTNIKTITLIWNDEGDPDDLPVNYREFMAEIWNDSGWRQHTTWIYGTDWEIELPEDGTYHWRVKAHDSLLESSWSTTYKFSVDSTSPTISIISTPTLYKWHNTNQTISWLIEDPSPGAGVDYFNWAWDVTPNISVDDDEGSTTLAAAGQGQHTLYIDAWDLAENSISTTWGWIGYDSLAPDVIFNSSNPPATTWYNSPQTIGWTITDPTPGAGVGGFIYAWDEGLTINWGHITHLKATQGSSTLPRTQGKHPLFVQSYDNANNASLIKSSGWLGYDTLIPTAPQITIDCAVPNNQWQSTCTTPTFSWSSTDPDAPRNSDGIKYAASWGITPTISVGDFGNVSSYTPTLVPAIDETIKYYLHVQAKDAAGNLSSPATFGFWYDGTGAIPKVNASSIPPFGGEALKVLSLGGLRGAKSQPDNLRLEIKTEQQLNSAQNSFKLTLNNNQLFTNNPTLSITTGAPNVTEVLISPVAEYLDDAWQPYPLTTTHTIPAMHNYFTPYRLYTWFKNTDGEEYGPYFDEIIYDPILPTGQISIGSSTQTDITLTIMAQDDNSGMADMRFGSLATITQSTWLPYTHTATYPIGEAVIYAQFRDRAGNISYIYGTDGSNLGLTEKTYLPIIFNK